MKGSRKPERKNNSERPSIARQQQEEKLIKGIVQKEQIMYMDLMFVNNIIYYICVMGPSEYVIVKKIGNKSSASLLGAMQRSISQIEKAGMKVVLVRCDSESGVESEWLQNRLSVQIDTTGDEAVGVIERKIRTMKERARAIICTLPMRLTDQLLDWLMQSVAYMINGLPTKNTIDGRSPREKVYGRCINAKTDLRHGFGNYMQVGRQSTENTMKEQEEQ